MLAAVAGKAVKELTYHRDYAAQWVLRLGDGTELSHARMQAGLDGVWPHVEELFRHPTSSGASSRPASPSIRRSCGPTSTRSSTRSCPPRR